MAVGRTATFITSVNTSSSVFWVMSPGARVCFGLLAPSTHCVCVCLHVCLAVVRPIWDLHLARDNRTQLKEIRCCDVSGRSPAAARPCCSWPRPHSSADPDAAEAQLVGCLCVCLCIQVPVQTVHPPPLSTPSTIHHTTCGPQLCSAVLQEVR